MIFRIFPTKDTFLTDFRLQNVAQTGSNFGASEILHVFSVAPMSMSAGIVSGSVGRVLTRFDVSRFTGATGSITGSVSYKLRLADARHSDTLPASYDLEILQLTRDWDEGRGQDVDSFGDRGVANWIKAKSNVFWTSPGGDFSLSPMTVFHVDEGHEDVIADVTSHVNSWLSGTSNNGFVIRLSSSLEYSSSDFFVKKFHSRETHFSDRVPYLEASWNDVTHTGSVTLATSDGPFFVNVTNIRNDYHTDDKVRFKLFVREKDFNPAVVLTASSGPTGVVVDRSYYRVDNDRTDEVVVPFGTGSNQATRLSYDSSGSFFDFYMSNLPPDEVYRLIFLFDVGGQRQVIDDSFKFRVR